LKFFKILFFFFFKKIKDLQTKPNSLDYSNTVNSEGYQTLATSPPNNNTADSQYQSLGTQLFNTIEQPVAPPGYQTMETTPDYQPMSTAPFKRTFSAQSSLAPPSNKLPPVPAGRVPPTPPRRQYQSTDLRSNDVNESEGYQSKLSLLFF